MTPSATIQPTPSSLRRNTRKTRVLCVDDERGATVVLKLLLELCGYEVETAQDGERAWELISSKGADLVVTDQNMPRLTGCELAARVRSGGFDLPIILVSARIEEVPVATRRALGIHAALSKPFERADLLRSIHSALATAPVTHPSG